jgi:hypothetical protein
MVGPGEEDIKVPGKDRLELWFTACWNEVYSDEEESEGEERGEENGVCSLSCCSGCEDMMVQLSIHQYKCWS